MRRGSVSWPERGQSHQSSWRPQARKLIILDMNTVVNGCIQSTGGRPESRRDLISSSTACGRRHRIDAAPPSSPSQPATAFEAVPACADGQLDKAPAGLLARSKDRGGRLSLMGSGSSITSLFSRAGGQSRICLEASRRAGKYPVHRT
jgi:hypothetical protein